jgi:hypothetical protein
VDDSIGSGTTAFVTEAANPLNRTDIARANPLERRFVGHGGALLRADLDDAVIFSRCLDHLAAFPYLVRCGFFDIDVFARLAGPDGDKRMPMVGRRGGDRVDLLVLQKLANVGVGFELDVVLLIKTCSLFFEVIAVNITDSHQPNALALLAEILHVAATLAADTDDGDANVIISAEHARRRSG